MVLVNERQTTLRPTLYRPLCVVLTSRLHDACNDYIRIYGNATRAAGTIVDIILLPGPVLPPGGLL